MRFVIKKDHIIHFDSELRDFMEQKSIKLESDYAVLENIGEDVLVVVSNSVIEKLSEQQVWELNQYNVGEPN